MKCQKHNMLLYAVTDRSWLCGETLKSQVKKALRGGITCLQLREKELPDELFLEEAIEIGRLCSQYGIPLIINDNIDVALKCHADGLHIGQTDMPAHEARDMIGKDMILGVSVQSVEQALKAQEDGADYLGVGAMFHTDTKKDAELVPLSVLREICASVQIPVTAIGGINAENMTLLSSTGVDGVALVSEIFASNDIEEKCKELLRIASKAFLR